MKPFSLIGINVINATARMRVLAQDHFYSDYWLGERYLLTDRKAALAKELIDADLSGDEVED